ncbi:hypothetical protein CLAFUW4_13813 [Fulvia fulva]|uniref:Efflux pump aflT n=1 Tax=Passalora fulva TaxID=5499 RepID=A0A9Q8PLC3_PASFU|nr:Efflux pump aflT [Fulvia fulva]KAK4610475.1 hypothetical protein CLAFUR4_13815 [Fulvia fulva]KAK4611306.1 hypothetical protein CLAFUR0_13819 [Fulvia fulva]UJO24630.1 Efflux pump aflT [Fulvia fulva]WPV21740.1 hypothetical protein CLAFUW4_13813 [Fulvia fulva]WPV37310.1 hypothetical protein CLAFUW7_13821 [Fulvia fulva]
MTTCGFQLFFGKVYSSYSHKWVFLYAFALFKIGPLLCGAANSSAMFIIGRAIAGAGGAGILSGAFIIISEAVSLERRANFSALIWAMYGLASCSGPLVGGVFTERVTWRWCFYLNLPVGALTAVVVIFFLESYRPSTSVRSLSLRKKLLDLDPLGSTLFISAVICLLLALQYAGTTWAWDSGRIVALLMLFGFLLILFGFLQASLGDNATWPKQVATQRSMFFGSIFSFCMGASYLIFAFYIPYYLQGIKNLNPLLAGVGVLPLILGQVGANLLGGVLVTRIGYYVPFMWLSVVFMAVGSGLLTTLTRDSSLGKWVGYQIIDGVGIGFGWQQGALAAQTVLDAVDVPVGTAIAVFMLLFGGAVFVSVANSVFTNSLVRELTAARIVGIDPATVVHLGATQLRQMVSGAELEAVLDGYMAALTDVYRVALILACISAVGVVGMEWIDVRKKGVKVAGGAA